MRVNWAIASATFAALILAAGGVQAGDGDAALQTAVTKAEQANGGQQEQKAEGKLTDRVVRIMLGFAWGMVPEEYAGDDGKTIKVDKSDPKKFLIPIDDARKVIRAASRSAYAQICGLADRQQANYVTFMRTEKARKVWSSDQMVFINSLHLFTVLYLTGNAKLVEKAEPGAEPAAADPAKAAPTKPPAKPGASATAPRAPAVATGPAADEPVKPPVPGMTPVPNSTAPGIGIGIPGLAQSTVDNQKRMAEAATDPNKPTCSPEQKERVQQAIDTYVKEKKS